MVDLVGIEPTTSSMPWKRAPSCATGPQESAVLQFSPSIVAASNAACPDFLGTLLRANRHLPSRLTIFKFGEPLSTRQIQFE